MLFCFTGFAMSSSYVTHSTGEFSALHMIIVPLDTQTNFHLHSNLERRAFPRRSLFSGQKCSFMQVRSSPASPKQLVLSFIFLAALQILLRDFLLKNFTTSLGLALSLDGTRCITAMSFSGTGIPRQLAMLFMAALRSPLE